MMEVSEIPTLLEDSEYTERDLASLEKLLEIRNTRISFALDHHRNTHAERMDFKNYPHIRDMYNSMAPVIVIMGAVQVMKSEFVIVDHFAAAYHGLSVFFVVPKFEYRTTFVQNRINRCVQNVEEYKKIIGRGFFDSVAIKSFGKGVIKYVGSNVLSDFREYPADYLVIDEIDECDQDNVNYALDRLRASKYQFKRYLGNPKVKDKGIHAYFMNSDQREWAVPCSNCGKYNPFDWFENVVEGDEDSEGNILNYRLRDTKWELGCKRDIYLICKYCGNSLERVSKEGRWMPQNPGHSVEGYHISMLCSPINPISGMWDRFQKAIHNPGKLEHFYNSELGLPYSAVGNRVTSQLLSMCVDEECSFVNKIDCAHIEDDSHDGPCSMGVDVGSFFDVRVSFLENKGVRRALFIGKLKTIEELYDLIRRYNVEKCVIDSMPETTLVQDFQDNADCDVWLCRYKGEGTDRRITYDGINRIVNIDRTEALDRSFAQLKYRKNILPANYESVLDGAFAFEMGNPVRRIIENKRGNSRYEWTKCVDHARHADSYDMLACSMLTEDTLDEIYIG